MRIWRPSDEAAYRGRATLNSIRLGMDWHKLCPVMTTVWDHSRSSALRMIAATPLEPAAVRYRVSARSRAMWRNHARAPAPRHRSTSVHPGSDVFMGVLVGRTPHKDGSEDRLRPCKSTCPAASGYRFSTVAETWMPARRHENGDPVRYVSCIGRTRIEIRGHLVAQQGGRTHRRSARMYQLSPASASFH